MIYEAYQEQLSKNQGFFDNWFSGVQSVLDGDTAGNLLNKINTAQTAANNAKTAADAAQIAANNANTNANGRAPAVHTHDISAIPTGTWPVSRGGTGVINGSMIAEIRTRGAVSADSATGAAVSGNYTGRYLRNTVMILEGVSWPATSAGDSIHVYK